MSIVYALSETVCKDTEYLRMYNLSEKFGKLFYICRKLPYKQNNIL